MTSGRSPEGAKASVKLRMVPARMGSPPFQAVSQELRSSAARSSGVVRVTQRSKAKLGAAEPVPR
jgi:hypothetical protein